MPSIAVDPTPQLSAAIAPQSQACINKAQESPEVEVDDCCEYGYVDGKLIEYNPHKFGQMLSMLVLTLMLVCSDCARSSL